MVEEFLDSHQVGVKLGLQEVHQVLKGSGFFKIHVTLTFEKPTQRLYADFDYSD
jgi:hypothetical protein